MVFAERARKSSLLGTVTFLGDALPEFLAEGVRIEVIFIISVLYQESDACKPAVYPRGMLMYIYLLSCREIYILCVSAILQIYNGILYFQPQYYNCKVPKIPLFLFIEYNNLFSLFRCSRVVVGKLRAGKRKSTDSNIAAFTTIFRKETEEKKWPASSPESSS